MLYKYFHIYKERISSHFLITEETIWETSIFVPAQCFQPAKWTPIDLIWGQAVEALLVVHGLFLLSYIFHLFVSKTSIWKRYFKAILSVLKRNACNSAKAELIVNKTYFIKARFCGALGILACQRELECVLA